WPSSSAAPRPPGRCPDAGPYTAAHERPRTQPPAAAGRAWHRAHRPSPGAALPAGARAADGAPLAPAAHHRQQPACQRRRRATVTTTQIAEYSATEAALATLREKYATAVFDVSTSRGMKDAREARRE